MLSLGLWPFGVFFHVAYTESLFLLLLLLVMYGIERRWHPVTVALIAGLASGTRAMGTALIVPLVLYVWQRMQSKVSATSQVFESYNQK